MEEDKRRWMKEGREVTHLAVLHEVLDPKNGGVVEDGAHGKDGKVPLVKPHRVRLPRPFCRHKKAHCETWRGARKSNHSLGRKRKEEEGRKEERKMKEGREAAH